MRTYSTLEDAIIKGHGTERSFRCPVHDDSHASASVNVNKGVWYCPSPSVRLLTSDLRWVPIGQLTIGDTLVGFDEEVVDDDKRQWRRSVVESVERIKQPCFDIMLADGRAIRASSGHQWLVESPGGGHRQWRTTKDLTSRKGGYCSIMTVIDTWDEDRDYESGYLAAAFDGEGSLIMRHRGRDNNSREVRLLFYQKPNATLDEVERCLKIKGFSYGKYLRDDGCYHLLISRKEEVLRFLGQIRPKRLLEKFDPDLLGGMSRMSWTEVVDVIDVGWQPVIAMKTSTSTYVAEGLASHNCYACGAKGRVDGYIPDQEGTDVRDEIMELLNEERVTHSEKWLDQFDRGPVHPYWLSRFAEETCREFRLGYDYGQDAPCYPLRDAQRRVLGVVHRNLDGVGPKYHYPRGVDIRHHLFNYEAVHQPVVVLVEGAMDAIAVWEAGYVGLACFGSHLSDHQVRLLQKIDPSLVVLMFDADRSGHAAARDAAASLEAVGISSVRPIWDDVYNDVAEMPITIRQQVLRTLAP